MYPRASRNKKCNNNASCLSPTTVPVTSPHLSSRNSHLKQIKPFVLRLFRSTSKKLAQKLKSTQEELISRTIFISLTMFSTSLRAAVPGVGKQNISFRRQVLGKCRALSTSSVGAAQKKNVVVVSGIRLPFSMASTIYKDEMAVDLQRLAIKGLMTQTAIDRNEIDYVICGNVIQEVRTSNIAR
jgi:hypothetical protein